MFLMIFNSREWADKGRAAVIAWLRHSRKLGWDVIYIMQDVNSIDKQIRAGLIEHEGVCKRSDRMSLPFVGGILRALGLGFLSRPPRVHVCTVKYGLSQHALSLIVGCIVVSCFRMVTTRIRFLVNLMLTVTLSAFILS